VVCPTIHAQGACRFDRSRVSAASARFTVADDIGVSKVAQSLRLQCSGDFPWPYHGSGDAVSTHKYLLSGCECSGEVRRVVYVTRREPSLEVGGRCHGPWFESPGPSLFLEARGSGARASGRVRVISAGQTRHQGQSRILDLGEQKRQVSGDHSGSRGLRISA
jgi:hypothetical protein